MDQGLPTFFELLCSYEATKTFNNYFSDPKFLRSASDLCQAKIRHLRITVTKTETRNMISNGFILGLQSLLFQTSFLFSRIRKKVITALRIKKRILKDRFEAPSSAYPMLIIKFCFLLWRLSFKYFFLWKVLFSKVNFNPVAKQRFPFCLFVCTPPALLMFCFQPLPPST